MEVHVTDRGLQRIQFADDQGKPGILEQAPGTDYGNPTYDVPNSSYVLLGCQEAPLKLNLDQVGELVEFLQVWLERGQFKTGTGGVFRVDPASEVGQAKKHMHGDAAKTRM